MRDKIGLDTAKKEPSEKIMGVLQRHGGEGHRHRCLLYGFEFRIGSGIGAGGAALPLPEPRPLGLGASPALARRVASLPEGVDLKVVSIGKYKVGK